MIGEAGCQEHILERLTMYCLLSMRYISGSEFHRIISARAAEKEEIKEYEAAKLADGQW